jgi:hypothetical protein
VNAKRDLNPRYRGFWHLYQKFEESIEKEKLDVIILGQRVNNLDKIKQFIV